MIVSYSGLHNLVSLLTQNSEDIGSIQKIYSSPHHLVFQVRKRGKTYYLMMGRGNQYQGMWVSDKNIPASFRANDRFCEIMRSRIKGSKIINIKICESDRAIQFEMVYKKAIQNLFLFWRGRDLFFSLTRKEGSIIHLFNSWEGQLTIAEEDFSIDFINIYKGLIRKEKEKLNKFDGEKLKIEKYFEQLNVGYFLRDEKSSNKKIKKLSKKIQNIKKDLEKIKQWKKAQDFIKNNSIEIGDWFEFDKIKFKIQEGQTLHQKRDYIFNKLKGYRKAEVVLTKRLIEAREEVDGKFNNSIRLPKIIQPIWFKEQKIVKTAKKDNVNEYDVLKIKERFIIGVGKTARGNDQLRKEFGKKEDMWFHIYGESSAHLILKNNKGEEILLLDYEIIGSILADYSGYKRLEVPLVYTQVKRIKGVKNSPGKVTLKNQKYINVQYNKEWSSLC